MIVNGMQVLYSYSHVWLLELNDCVACQCILTKVSYKVKKVDLFNAVYITGQFRPNN